jgi:hypothetical protein
MYFQLSHSGSSIFGLFKFRVARWFIFKPKILEGLRMENVGIFNAHLENIVAVWYILWSLGNFGIFFPVLVYCVKKKSGNPVSNLEIF